MDSTDVLGDALDWYEDHCEDGTRPPPDWVLDAEAILARLCGRPRHYVSRTAVYAVDPHTQEESWIADCNKGHHSLAECNANARLIAAAPEMVDLHQMHYGSALEAIRFLDQHDLDNARHLLEHMAREARALLAKIDGEA